MFYEARPPTFRYYSNQKSGSVTITYNMSSMHEMSVFTLI